mmetsp:Transcript_94703/g.276960  ORF Transcript_94703/g.276960 Transcript_94703/m.276960 type:complete len:236 (-) Transcript_94703:580-1287(-)
MASADCRRTAWTRASKPAADPGAGPSAAGPSPAAGKPPGKLAAATTSRVGVSRPPACSSEPGARCRVTRSSVRSIVLLCMSRSSVTRSLCWSSAAARCSCSAAIQASRLASFLESSSSLSALHSPKLCSRSVILRSASSSVRPCSCRLAWSAAFMDLRSAATSAWSCSTSCLLFRSASCTAAAASRRTSCTRASSRVRAVATSAAAWRLASSAACCASAARASAAATAVVQRSCA